MNYTLQRDFHMKSKSSSTITCISFSDLMSKEPANASHYDRIISIQLHLFHASYYPISHSRHS